MNQVTDILSPDEINDTDNLDSVPKWPIRRPKPNGEVTRKIHDTLSATLSTINLDTNLSIDDFNEMFLLFTSLFSYYLNSEEVGKNTFTREVMLIVSSYFEGGKIYEGGKKYVDYIKRHLEAYQGALQCWEKSGDNDVTPESFKEILMGIGSTMFGYEEFRFLLVTHGEGERLLTNGDRKTRKKIKWATPADMTKESNFVFPPATRMQGLFEAFSQEFNNAKGDVLKQASLIYAFVFLIHPFDDGNSRTARIATVSYLESKGFSRYRLFTFLTQVQEGFMGYKKLLEKYAYDWYGKNKMRIQINSHGNSIESYPDNEEYVTVIRNFSGGVYDELNKVYDFVDQHLEKILIIFATLKHLLMTNFDDFHKNHSYPSTITENKARHYFDETKKRILQNIFDKLTSKKVDFTKSVFEQIGTEFNVSKGHLRRIGIRKNDMSVQEHDDSVKYVESVNYYLYTKYVQGNTHFLDTNMKIKPIAAE